MVEKKEKEEDKKENLFNINLNDLKNLNINFKFIPSIELISIFTNLLFLISNFYNNCTIYSINLNFNLNLNNTIHSYINSINSYINQIMEIITTTIEGN